MSAIIRFAERSDVATILHFVRELAAYERAADAVVATEGLLAGALFAAPPAMEALIAEVDGAAVGMALFFHNFSTWTGARGLYLEDLYVTPSARGTGVGKALLKRLARVAKERGCTRFEWSVLTWNAPAIAFYRSLGAETLEEWRVNRVTGEALDRLAEDR